MKRLVLAFALVACTCGLFASEAQARRRVVVIRNNVVVVARPAVVVATPATVVIRR